MGSQENEVQANNEERKKHHFQVVYTRKTQERQIFMQELRQIRKRRERHLIKDIKDSIGPIWYQALSVPQRKALDILEFSIYQDILEGRPVRTAVIIQQLGLHPKPNTTDLMNCVYLGRDDLKQLFANMFENTYGHTIQGKRAQYDINARLMLSAILYLGIKNLIAMLKKRFAPDTIEKPPQPKIKPQPPPPLESPYLQDMVAVLWVPRKKEPFKPAPLPNLDDLNEPYYEDPPLPKPPPPPPPPPPPKKTLPKAYCDKLAGIMRIEPHASTATVVKTITKTTQKNRSRGAKVCLTEVKKTYGLQLSRTKKSGRRRKLRAPDTGLSNAKYTINGVYKIQGKTVFVLGSVSVLPPEGDLIHGGNALVNGVNINVHCGFRGRPPPPKPDPCDCVKKWQDSVFEYVKENKCFCGHYYDYGNEGTFLPEELPFFQKPTKFSSYQFNYDTIYDLDEKQLHVRKEFKRIWETDSALQVGDPSALEKKDKKKKKVRKSSKTCLGDDPQPEDYLKCALRHMRRDNIAARLPDIHLVPELKEWIRRRIHGPLSRNEKNLMMQKSANHWQMLMTMARKGYGHVNPRKDQRYSTTTNWRYKQNLNDKFREFTEQYKLELFRSYAKITNMFWPTMCQAQFRDKKFREIFFSYFYGRKEDIALIHPYSSRECAERKNILQKKRYLCLPAGIETDE